MNKTLQSIDKLIMELYGARLLEPTISPRLSAIRELGNAHNAMLEMVKDNRRPLTTEFIQCIYPLAELAFQWDRVKKEGSHTRKFRQRCKRLAEQKLDEGNFYGSIFEIGMAAGYLLKGWKIKFPEDKANDKKKIDFILHKEDKQQPIGGVECSSKRYAERWGKHGITIDALNAVIIEKAEKFNEENLSELPLQPNVKLLFIDLTRADYSVPTVLGDLQSGIKLSDKLDAVVFAWTEQVLPRLTARISRRLSWQYQVVGDAKKAWLPERWETLVFESSVGQGSVRAYANRPYVYPPPTIKAGQTETLEEYLEKSKREL